MYIWSSEAKLERTKDAILPIIIVYSLILFMGYWLGCVILANISHFDIIGIIMVTLNLIMYFLTYFLWVFAFSLYTTYTERLKSYCNPPN